MLAPFGTGPGSVTESEELKPPPFGCCTPAEVSSSVVPWTVTVQGAVGGTAGGVCTAPQVEESLTLLTTTSLDVIARRSAKLGLMIEDGKVLMSIMRKRRRVTDEPVLLT